MELWTIQMSRWRLAKERGIDFIDTTVKGGSQAFGPSWDMVLGHKAGTLSDEQYTEQYVQRMRASVREHGAAWNELGQHDKIALACFCRTGAFCHRHLLAGMVTKYLTSKGITVQFHGELAA